MSNERALRSHSEAMAAGRPAAAAVTSHAGSGLSCANDNSRWKRRGLSAVALAVSLALGACETAPTKPPQAAPAVVSLQEYMQQAAKAAADGSHEKARDTYRAAAMAYPASKEPWVKLAEDYFEAADYGNAILAAQEVLLRDSTDNVAASVLAVGGLRVSVAALQTLRAQNNIAGNTRSEAETMTRTLREVLGEKVLVPRPATPPSPSPRSRPKTRPDTAAPATGAAPSHKATPASTAASAAGNPFDKLK